MLGLETSEYLIIELKEKKFIPFSQYLYMHFCIMSYASKLDGLTMLLLYIYIIKKKLLIKYHVVYYTGTIWYLII